MFEKAVISGFGPEQGVDLGLVFETLLYYGHVHIVFNSASLRNFLGEMTAIEAIEFFSREGVSASFSPEYLGTMTNNDSGFPVHDIVQFQITSHANKKETSKKKQLIEAICYGSSLTKDSRRTEIIRKKIKLVELPKNEVSLPNIIRSGLDDKRFVDHLLRVHLKKFNVSHLLPSNYRFQIIKISNGFVVDTNLDFPKYSEIVNSSRPDNELTVSAASVFTEYAEAQRHAYYASKYLGELVTDPVSASIIRHKIAGLLDLRKESMSNLDAFQELVLPEAVNVRSTINEGKKSISDFFHLLDKAEKFRTWLRQQPDEASIVKEYHKAISKISWLQKRPTKVARFMTFTGGGTLLDPVLGAALGAADSLFLDRLVSGWKPNQFINGPLNDFLS